MSNLAGFLCPYCGMTLDAHGPTRCLDAWIADKVVGMAVVAMDWPCGYDPECGSYEAEAFVRKGEDGSWHATGGWYTERGPVTPMDEQGWPPDETPQVSLPGEAVAALNPVAKFSTDIREAAGLLKYLMDEDLFIEYWSDGEWFIAQTPLTIRRRDGTRGLTAAKFDDHRDDRGPSSSDPVPALCLAICRAALKHRLGASSDEG